MDDDFSHSVAWEINPQPPSSTNNLSSSTTDLEDVTDYSPPGPSTTTNQPSSSSTKPNQSTTVQVRDGKIELEGTKDMFVSYLVTATVSRQLRGLPSAARSTGTSLSICADHCTAACRTSPACSKPSSLPPAVASRTSASCAATSSRTFPPRWSRPCLRSTGWVRIHSLNQFSPGPLLTMAVITRRVRGR
jgi:hypothetical protein